MALRRVRVTIVAVEIQYVLNFMSVSIIALVILHAKRMRHILLPSVACGAQLYFSTLSHKQHGFSGNIVEHKNMFYFFLHFSGTFLVLRRAQQNIAVNVHTSSCKVPVILVIF